MIFNCFMVHNNKIINQSYVINKKDNIITIDIIFKYKGLTKVPVYTNNIMFHEVVYFPFVFDVIDGMILSPYMVFMGDDNEYDKLNFFKKLENYIFAEYNIRFYSMKSIISSPYNLIKTVEGFKDIELDEKLLFTYINYIKLYLYYLHVKKINILKISDINSNIKPVINEVEYDNINTHSNFIDFCNTNIDNIPKNSEYVLKLNPSQLFINTEYFIKCIEHINLFPEDFKYQLLLDYYYNNRYLSNKLYIFNIKDCDTRTFRSNNYDNNFFMYYIKKYSNNSSEISFNLDVLSNNILYSFLTNKININTNLDRLIYYSFIHNKYIDNMFSNDNINKTKNSILKTIKILINIMKGSVDEFIYSRKIYYDNIFFTIIYSFLSNINKSSLAIKYFYKNVNKETLSIVSNIFFKLIHILDLSRILTIDHINKDLINYKIYYDNHDLLYYNNKITNILYLLNLNQSIYSVIYNSFEMFKYLHTEEEFIDWVYIINNKINMLYKNIKVNKNDYKIVGKILYYYFNIKQQNILDQSYIDFILLCGYYKKLIIYNKSIDIRFNDIFNNKNINFGILIKHILQINYKLK